MDPLGHTLCRPAIAPLTAYSDGGAPLKNESLSPGMRVGLFGGSFNPAHEGHLHVARTALNRLQLDRVWFLVSPQNPLKDAADTQDYRQRLEALRALAAEPRFVVSDVERRLGADYSLQTVLAMTARWPDVKFVWLMGADNLAGFHRWRGWTQIMGTLPVAVIARPDVAVSARLGHAARQYAHNRIPAAAAKILPDLTAPAWTYLTAPLHAHSSSEIRARARQKTGCSKGLLND